MAQIDSLMMYESGKNYRFTNQRTARRGWTLTRVARAGRVVECDA